MGWPPVGQITKASSIIELGNETVQLIAAVSDLLTDDTSGLAEIAHSLSVINGNITSIGPSISELGDSLVADLTRIKDATGAIEAKVSVVQYILTGAFGTEVPAEDYPVLDLRNFLGGVQYFAPGNGTLFDWLSYIARRLPPGAHGGLRFLGHAAGPATFNVPDCLAIKLTATVVPVGAPGSAHPLAPVFENLGRVSFQTYGGWTAAEKINHPSQLFYTQGANVAQVAIEPTSQTEFDVHAVMPLGFI